MHSIWLGSTLLALYVGFWFWWGGRGRPLSEAERQHYLNLLSQSHVDADGQAELEQVRELVAQDDGREFVMQNLARYRARAAYPAGSRYGDDPRAADRRYAKAIVPELLKRGCLILFVASVQGRFLAPPGADDWHYVAMVRYRSRRDFLRFACAIQRDDIVMHKWAALEKTHVFPVKPIISLFNLRLLVFALLLLLGMLLGSFGI
jgi:hypothetical protein